MDKKIIYLQDNGIVAVITPATKTNETLQEIISKSVPKGKKYKIVNATEIPSDREFRNAWTINEAELTDGVGE